jgi:hypothetical protein
MPKASSTKRNESQNRADEISIVIPNLAHEEQGKQ